MRWQDDVARFARDLAIQQIGYWREAKREGLPITAAHARRMALHHLAQARRIEHERDC